MSAYDDEDQDWPAIRQWTCLGCCCEFYILELLVPEYCPHCGARVKVYRPDVVQAEKEGSD